MGCDCPGIDWPLFCRFWDCLSTNLNIVSIRCEEQKKVNTHVRGNETNQSSKAVIIQMGS